MDDPLVRVLAGARVDVLRLRKGKMVRPDRVELPTFWFVASPNSKRRERRALDAPKASTYPLVSPVESAVHRPWVLQLSALSLSVGSHRIQNGEVRDRKSTRLNSSH